MPHNECYPVLVVSFVFFFAEAPELTEQRIDAALGTDRRLSVTAAAFGAPGVVASAIVASNEKAPIPLLRVRRSEGAQTR
jgi:hypothetical protein